MNEKSEYLLLETNFTAINQLNDCEKTSNNFNQSVMAIALGQIQKFLQGVRSL